MRQTHGIVRIALGAVAFALGAMAVAGPTGAGADADERTVKLDTKSVMAGKPFTVSAIDMCVSGEQPNSVGWKLTGPDSAVVAEGTVTPDPRGMWTASVTAPAAGNYTFEAACLVTPESGATAAVPYESLAVPVAAPPPPPPPPPSPRSAPVAMDLEAPGMALSPGDCPEGEVPAVEAPAPDGTPPDGCAPPCPAGQAPTTPGVDGAMPDGCAPPCPPGQYPVANAAAPAMDAPAPGAAPDGCAPPCPEGTESAGPASLPADPGGDPDGCVPAASLMALAPAPAAPLPQCPGLDEDPEHAQIVCGEEDREHDWGKTPCIDPATNEITTAADAGIPDPCAPAPPNTTRRWKPVRGSPRYTG